MSNKESQPQLSSAPNPSEILVSAGGKAVLAEANRQTDVLIISLSGVACIILILLLALALPVLGLDAITSKIIYAIIVLVTLGGVYVLGTINLKAHRRVTVQSLLTEVLLNSLGQGYLSFDSNGVCGQVYSQACLDLLEIIPAEKNILDVLRLTNEQRSDFKDWVDMLFVPNHALTFDDVVKFLPQTYAHSDKTRRVGLVYRPVRDKNGLLLNIIVIATDQTEEAEAEVRARAQQNFVAMISRIFKERSQFMVTITHLRKFVDDSKISIKREEAAPILRLLHTLKASAKHFCLESISNTIHRLEADLRNPNLQSDTEFQECLIKGGEELNAGIKTVLDEAGELIGQDFEGRASMREIDQDVIYEFAEEMRDRKIDPDLVRLYLTNIAAVPINETFRQFDRELKDLAVILGKKVKPVLYTGTNPRILLQPMEEFILSTMHICRNIIDHGIEPAVTRLARGKDPAGLVMIHTDLIDNPETGRKMLQIVISDDGNGIDPALVRKKLQQIDPEGPWRYDNDEDVIQRILLWEVSTRTEVNELSGRGVGMEAVDREVKLLGGTIKVYSELYKGTRFDIRIPYGLDVPLHKVRKAS